MRSRFVAVGDDYNDVPMLEEADLSFVAGDGVEEVRKYGTVVSPCDRGVIADVIEYLEAAL